MEEGRSSSCLLHERTERGHLVRIDTYDGRAVTVTEGFRQSVDLVFARLMPDVVNHCMYWAPSTGAPGSKAHVLDPLIRGFAKST